LWLPLATIGVRALVESPDLADKNGAMVTVGSEAVTTQATADRTQGR